METGGSHLGVVRNWIQWKAFNGSYVIWGSNEYLKLKDITVFEMESLARDIKTAVLAEHGIEQKNIERQKRFVVFAEEGPAFQSAQTWQEVWECLTNVLSEKVTIYYRAKGHLVTALDGSVMEVAQNVMDIVMARTEDPCDYS